MNNKFYVSLEVARLLKEKGCNVERDFLTHVYNENGHLYWSNCEDLSDKIPAPTKAEAMDLIEANTGFIISEDRKCDGLWYYVIFLGNDIYYDSVCFVDGSFSTRWEAQEAAMIKVLTEYL